MKSININIPESLDEIPLEQYQEYEQIEEPTERDVLRIFLGLSDKIIDKLPLHEVERVKSIVLALFNTDHQIHGVFKLNGKEFGFIPNLDQISFGENGDVNKYIGDWGQMHKAMAVLYRPITHRKKDKYIIEEYEGSSKYAEVLKQMPLSVVFGAFVFFYSLANDLLRAIPNSIQKKMQKTKSKKGSLIDGDSITKSIQLLRAISGNLIQLPDSPYINV